VSGLLFIGLCLEVLAFWQGLPHVPQVLQGWAQLWVNGTLPHDILVSSARWFIGWALGALVGVSLGFLTGRVAAIRLSSEGPMILARSIPFISLVPLVIRVWGSAETGKIALVAWASATICWIVVHQAALNLPVHLEWRARSLGIPKRVWLFQVLIPTCRTALLSALRTSLTIGLLVVAVAEIAPVLERKPDVFVFWSEGLGYRLFRTLDQARDDLMLATILTFALMGVIVEPLFVSLWNMSHRVRFKARQRKVTRITNSVRQPPGTTQSMPESHALKVEALSASYGNKTVLNDLSLEIKAGQTLSLVGPSGCGKTTLVRSIGHFTDGTLTVRGSVLVGSVKQMSPGPWVGVVWQDAQVFEHLTVFDNVMIGAALRERPTTKREHAWNLLKSFGLEMLAAEPASSLSGGQMQRLSLAVALANQPQLLLLDEPFGALDAITRRKMQSFYWTHVHGHVTSVFVTHDLEEAMLVGDFVRVGIHPGASEIRMEKRGLDPHEWEKTPEFDQLRRHLIGDLEQVAARTHS
jgi:ABC-type nitrate/sulfonate/bicarbonate transport system ATPase subunit/ABC-type nitrate/sulfonate/bicarbonate transport system permease component